MKLTKKTQYGVLLALYLARAGRANTGDVAEGLGIPRSFLEQIARRLRMAGVIQAVRGPGGGYELAGEPTMGDVLSALGSAGFLRPAETLKYSVGGSEERAFGLFIGNLSSVVSHLFTTPVREVAHNLARTETALLETVTEAQAN